MSLCNLTIQYLESQHLDRLTANCPVAGCGLPVARHRDENAQAGNIFSSHYLFLLILSASFPVTNSIQ